MILDTYKIYKLAWKSKLTESFYKNLLEEPLEYIKDYKEHIKRDFIDTSDEISIWKDTPNKVELTNWKGCKILTLTYN